MGNSYQVPDVCSVHWGANARVDALHLLASNTGVGRVTWLAIGF